MAHEQSIEEWARTAELPTPPRWGEIEKSILTRAPRPDTGIGQLVILVVVVGLLVLFTASPLIGLSIVVSHAVSDPVTGPWIAADIAFLTANVLCLTTLSVWSGPRRREPRDLVIAGGTGALSLAAYLILVGMPDGTDTGWAGWLTLVAAVFGLGLFVVIVVASKPGRRRELPLSVRARTLLSPPSESHYMTARERALQTLVDGRRVELDDDARRELVSMPLGSWHELDPAGRR